MRGIDQIRETLINRGSISELEAMIKYKLLPSQLLDICYKLRDEGYFIKKYEEILFYRYLLINKDKN
jgi:hypothetical protein